VSETPRTFQARPADADQRIEAFLAARLAVHPAHAEKLLRQGRVQAEGRTLARGDRLLGKEWVEVFPPSGDKPPPLPDRKLRLAVVHEDPALAVVVKPSSLAMHPGPAHGSGTLLNGLIALFPEMLELGSEREYGLVHRLDMATSGVVVVARSEAAYAGLVAAFSERRVEKVYLALVRGAPRTERVEAAIGDQEAITELELLERAGEVGLLRARPLTGRTHQVRIHAGLAGAPVLHDDRYGQGADDLTAKLYLNRMALHAHRLAFEHPVTGARCEYEVPLPRDLKRAWKRALKLFG